MTKNTKEKISFREKMKDKKYNAKVQLFGYAIFIVIAIIYINISNKNYDYNYANKITNTTSNPELTNQITENKSLLETITNNYEYNIKVTITNTDSESTNYEYHGTKFKNIQKINTNNQIYYLKDNQYYQQTNNTYQVVESNIIYSDLDNNYFELDKILNYLKKSSLDHTTNYSNGQTISTYYLYLKDILSNYHEDKYIEFAIKEIDDILYIDIDYTNLIQYNKEEIQDYKVSLIYSNIDKVEEFNIEIPLSKEE